MSECKHMYQCVGNQETFESLKARIAELEKWKAERFGNHIQRNQIKAEGIREMANKVIPNKNSSSLSLKRIRAYADKLAQSA